MGGHLAGHFQARLPPRDFSRGFRPLLHTFQLQFLSHKTPQNLQEKALC